ncbi:hypothetical protein CH373_02145 [Leptospira perolatii]|uniref:Uncharacterized protein n=1 Tax=Leptospira perolatii TaxID=2023191 RepID=A0A2M9ZSB2_9LEPT|nr:hypothetical protein [Leptospira perolatii]PJZ71327.1 hypothetical protein CH360_02145 [Leptospira perolatii]PJZ74861.1 hypothetical protein CH373_02145 [Leptospira perolatii]
MVKVIFYSLLFLAVGSAQASTLSEFKQLLEKYSLSLEEDKEYSEIKLEEGSKLKSDFTLRHISKKLEIRYIIQPVVPELESKLPGLYILQAQNIAMIICQCKDRIIGLPFSRESIKSEFGADWGATLHVASATEFSKDYAFAIVIALYRKGKANAYTIFLFDDFIEIREELKKALYHLKFKGEIKGAYSA